MIVSYYPGCTLKTKAKVLDQYVRKSAEVLGITMCEPENWQCCGGVFSMAKDEIASKLSAVRLLSDAKQKDRTIVTACAACHNVLMQTNYAMQHDTDFAFRVNNYIKPEPEYDGSAQVKFFLEYLRDVVGFDRIARKVTNPLTGKKIGAYYGCLLLRPSKALKLDDPENPTIIEDFIRALGAEPVIYGMRNECCGGYVTADSPEFAEKRSAAVCDSAAAAGADMLITACPLCKYNLEKCKSENALPVRYFSELLAEALGIKKEEE